MRHRYRLLASLGLLLGTTFAVFALLEVSPGGSAAAYVQSPSSSANTIAELQRELGPGRPMVVRYVIWVSHVLRGDLGWSPNNSEPVSLAISERLPATIELTGATLVTAVVLGAILGVARARAPAPMVRNVFAGTQLLVRSMPIIVFAMAFVLLVALAVPSLGFGIASVDGFDFLDRLRHLVAPVLCLAIPFSAWMSVIFYDFFRTAEDASRTLGRSFLKPVTLSIALVGPAVLAACLLIEPMFAWPGVARIFHAGLTTYDSGVTAGCLLISCAALVLARLVADLASIAPGQALPHRPNSQRINAAVAVPIVVLLAAGLGAVTANVIGSGDPYYIDQANWAGYPLAPGVAGHPLGTDENGRDLFSRLLFGLRTSLGIAAFAALIASAIAFACAHATRALRVVDATASLSVVGIRAFGAVPLVLAFVAVLVVHSHTIRVLTPVAIALVMSAVLWPGIVPAFRTRSSATLGAMVNVMGCALLLEFTQSAIGFGVQPPTPSLGNMLANAVSNFTIAPWIPAVPIAAVIAVLAALYALGDQLRQRA